LFFFLSPYWQKYCSFIPAGFFCPHSDKHLVVLSKRIFDTQSIHIFGLVYYLCQYGDKKKNNQRTKLSIYISDTIESESTTRSKNRSSDRMMTSDWLVDVSDDRYTTRNSTWIIYWPFSKIFPGIDLIGLNVKILGNNWAN
jgi:hypothetical protein